MVSNSISTIKYNRLLERQLRRHLNGQSISTSLEKLLEAVNDSYEHYERDRYLLDHAMQLTSDELMIANERLKKEAKSQKKANELSEAKYQTIIQNLAEGVVITGLDGKIDFVNESFCKMSGFSEEELMQDFELKNILHPEFRDKIKEKLKNRRKGISESYELQHVKKDGTIWWARVNAAPFKNTKGEIVGTIAALTDISEQKNAFEEIEKLAVFPEKNPEPIIRVTADGDLDYSNLASRELLNHWQNSRNNSFKLKFLKYIKKAFNENKILQIELSHLKKTYLTQFNPNLEKGFVYIYAKDITESKKVQEALKDQNEELNKINKELDRFVYSASHDLRAPLTSILGLLNLVDLALDDEEKTKYLRLIRKSIGKLDSFIKDIIDFSRNARMELNIQKINLETLINEILADLKFLPNANLIEIKTDLKLKKDFFTDKRRLTIVLTNIISNAIKYHDFGKTNPEINIEAKTTKKKTIISISDNGRGMQEVVKNRIFEMFYRASEDSKGSGIGLYIVQETIRKLKGKIKVKSTYGIGTSFIISIKNES